MTAVIQAQGSMAASSAGGHYYNSYGNSAFGNLALDTNQGRITYRLAGVSSKLNTYVHSSNTTTTITLKLRKGGTNGNQSVSITGSTTGYFEDSSNTDSISAGDTVDLDIDGTAAGGSYACGSVSSLFAASSNTVTQLTCSGIRSWSSTATHYLPLAGNNDGANTTENRAEQYVGVAGTLKKMGVRVNSNTSSAAQTMRSRKNGANGNMSISITASTSGVFEDTSNTDSFSAGDLGNYLLDFTASTVSFDMSQAWSAFESTSSEGLIFWGKAASGMNINAYPRYISVGGFMATPATTESTVGTKANTGFDAKKLSIYVSANTSNLTLDFAFRLNTATTTALTVSITLAVTGRFTDSSNTATVASGDTITHRWNSSGSMTGSLTIRTVSMSATYSGVAPTTKLKDMIRSGGIIPWKR